MRKIGDADPNRKIHNPAPSSKNIFKIFFSVNRSSRGGSWKEKRKKNMRRYPEREIHNPDPFFKKYF
jgi:hypothetical protein